MMRVEGLTSMLWHSINFGDAKALMCQEWTCGYDGSVWLLDGLVNKGGGHSIVLETLCLFWCSMLIFVFSILSIPLIAPVNGDHEIQMILKSKEFQFTVGRSDFIFALKFGDVKACAYLKLCAAHSDTTVAMMLVGNKCDLETIRDVSVEEGKSLAEAEGLFFMETSALDSTNVKKAFEIVIREIYNNVSRKVLNSDTYKAELTVNRVTLTKNETDGSKQTQNFSCCSR
ncbi:hypothetical protein CRYUN_Cryun21dG0111400 [Craigia yunnanensis]